MKSDPGEALGSPGAPVGAPDHVALLPGGEL